VSQESQGCAASMGAESMTNEILANMVLRLIEAVIGLRPLTFREICAMRQGAESVLEEKLYD